MNLLDKYYVENKNKVDEYFENLQDRNSKTPIDIILKGRLTGLTTTHLDVEDSIVTLYGSESISQSDLNIIKYKLEDMIKYVDLISKCIE